jgi:hypothetical protein
MISAVANHALGLSQGGLFCSSSWLQESSTASPLASLSVVPPAGNGAELPFAPAPFQPPEFSGLNLMLQVLGGLEQRRFERVVSGIGVQGRAMNEQRALTRVACGLGMHARSRNLQPHLDAEGRFGFPLVFENHVGGGYRRQAVQVFELFLHLPVPGDLGVDAGIAKGGFHLILASRAITCASVSAPAQENGRDARPSLRPVRKPSLRLAEVWLFRPSPNAR